MNYIKFSLNGTWKMPYPDTGRYDRIVYTYSVFQEAEGKAGIRNSEIPNDRVSAGYGTSEYYG